MKNLFILSEEEKNRILNLHETATKQHYLINEVGYGTGNWIDVNYQNKALTLNNYLEMENDQGGDELKLNAGVTFTILDANTLIAKNTDFQIVGDYTGSVSENSKGNVKYTCNTKRFSVEGRDLTYWGEDFQSNVQKAFDDLCGEAASPQQGGGQQGGGQQGSSGKQGWNMDKVIQKYNCLRGEDFAEYQVYGDQYGDVVKLKLGKNKNGQPVYGKMYLQDGYMVNWDSGVRIGKDDQYMACINSKLSFQTGKNFMSTDANSGRPQMESLNRIANIIKEDIDAGVISVAGGSSSNNKNYNGGKKQYTGPSNAQKVQTKLKELDPNAPQTGKMDQATLTLVMNILTNGKPSEKKPEEILATNDEKINNTMVGATGGSQTTD